MEKKRLNAIREALPNPRDHKKEVESLQATLSILGGKWRLLIINSICNGNKRFRDIERSIPGITPRMLSRELKDMETCQLITRTVFASIPVTVEYSETDYCLSFAPIIFEMIMWGERHKENTNPELS